MIGDDRAYHKALKQPTLPVDVIKNDPYCFNEDILVGASTNMIKQLISCLREQGIFISVVKYIPMKCKKCQ